MRQNCFVLLSAFLLAGAAMAEQPADAPIIKPAPVFSAESEAFVKKMMAFDKNNDGKLTKEEITDERLQRVFDRADTNKDGVVTKEELMALASQEADPANAGGEGSRGEGREGRGGFGSERREGREGGEGMRRGGMVRGQPGQIMPPFMQENLKLTNDQKKQFADLQKEVDTKVEGLLTEEQKTQLKALRARMQGGPGGPGGPGQAGEGRRRD